jgi:ATP adenylyltransferase/5',5'''-P-1,P-4-tetraphosphate phosphorylase II
MFSDHINELFTTQLRDWELARVNYAQLEKVRTRKIDFGTFDVFIQFNPERIKSSSAKVDSKSIGERPCFLCEKNRPQEQRGVTFGGSFTALVNPYPIFKRHLTIPSEKHTDQRIRNNFGTMLALTEELPSYTVFYNGPQCGASAPDHLHFQAGNRGFMPLEKDFLSGKHTRLVSGKEGPSIWLWTGYKRGIITLTGNDRKGLSGIFTLLFEKLFETQPEKPEPMLNILATFSEEGLTVHLIPRKKHRPSQFFIEGKDQIMISPAAVDLGGVIITPREEDFEKITEEGVEDLFSQVCFGEDELLSIIKMIQ